MKKMLAVILGAAIGFAAASWIVSNRLNVWHAAQLAEWQGAWQAEKAALEAALEKSRTHAPVIRVPGAAGPAAAPTTPLKLSPAEIVSKLVALKSEPANQPRMMRQAIYWLEELIAAGPTALPAIREFLGRNQDLQIGPLSQVKG